MKKYLFPVLLVAVTCTLAGVRAADIPATQAAGSLLTAEESKGVESVIASVLAAGFPDARKAVVYSGKITVRATFDPAKPPLPSEASNVQESIPNSKNMTYGYAFDGLHFKLSDGTWIISMAYRFKPAEGDKVNVADAKEIHLETLLEDASKANPFDAEKNAAKYLEGIAPEQRARSIQMLNRFAPVLQYLELNQDAIAPGIVLLHEAGWKQSGDLSLVVSDIRSRSFWQLRPWSTPDSIFDPTGAYAGTKVEEEAFAQSHPPYIPEAPETALRRAMFRWCRGQMNVSGADALLSLEVAAAGAKASVDPKDPQHFGLRIDLHAAGMKLPIEVPEKADLVTQLQSWEARPRAPKMVVASGGEGNTISMSTSFVAPVSAYIPKKADLDALVDLLADERPSRFVDFTGSRPVADNAWRALAILLESDPRTLAGYPTDHAWTNEERKAAAAAVQKWWKEHRTDYVGK